MPPDGEVVVVAASDGNELEAAELLAAVGLRVRGFLGGGMSAWRAEERPVARIEPIGPDDLAGLLDGDDPPLVLDVRGVGEYADGHIAGSLHIPYGELARRLDELPRDRALATICKGGKRSGLAASVLAARGLRDDSRCPGRGRDVAGRRPPGRGHCLEPHPVGLSLNFFRWIACGLAPGADTEKVQDVSALPDGAHAERVREDGFRALAIASARGFASSACRVLMVIRSAGSA